MVSRSALASLSASATRAERIAFILGRPDLRAAVERRFWAKVDRGAPDECWLWRTRQAKGGKYPMFSVGSQFTVSAHRLAHALLIGKWPGELSVLHRCSNKLCANPDHLYLGTQAQRMAEKVARGRHRYGTSPGQWNGSAKLTARKVAALRRRMAAGEPVRALALRFGIHPSQAYRIRRGEAWPLAA